MFGSVISKSFDVLKRFHTSSSNSFSQQSKMALPIAIVGGGPCGLTLARLLECKGIDYVVYERDESETSNRQGGTLDIHEGTGQRALKEAKLFDEFRKHARYEDDVFALYDKDGKLHLRHTGAAEGESGGGGRPEIDRFTLRKMLLDSIPKEKVRWGSPLKSLAVGHGASPVLQFADGSEESRFSLIVGADGAWSKVRSAITQEKPSYCGKTYLETKITHDNPVHGVMAKEYGPGSVGILGGKQIMLQRQGDGSYRIYFSCDVPEDFFRETVDITNIKATQEVLLSPDFFGTWNKEFTDLVKHADNFRRWGLYTMSEEAMSWKMVPGLTLVGDAAHVAIPAGEGVNEAMRDALVLSTSIEKHGLENVNDAVREYEEDMFGRAKAQIRGGWRLNELMSSPEGPLAFLKAMADGTIGE